MFRDSVLSALVGVFSLFVLLLSSTRKVAVWVYCEVEVDVEMKKELPRFAESQVGGRDGGILMTWLSWRIKVHHCTSLCCCTIRYGTNTCRVGEGRGRQGVMGDGRVLVVAGVGRQGRMQRPPRIGPPVTSVRALG